MSISRKRKRELKKLQELTNKLIGEQKEIMNQAVSVLGEAGIQARYLSKEHLSPRFNKVLNYIRPGINNSISVAKDLTNKAITTGQPVASKALTKAIASLETGNQKELAKTLKKFGEKQGLVKKKKSFGGILAVLLGVISIGAIGYSLWQVTRADEDIWIAAENDDE